MCRLNCGCYDATFKITSFAEKPYPLTPLPGQTLTRTTRIGIISRSMEINN